MQIETEKLANLHEDAKNARQHLPRNLKAIKASLKKWGQVEPLIIQKKNNKIIGGNGRFNVMKELNWTEVKIIRVDIDDTQAHLLGVALNRTAELAVWDEPRLADILEAAQSDDFEALGFSDDEVRALLEAPEVDIDALTENPLEEEPPIAAVEIAYTLVFDNLEQQRRFNKFLRQLKKDFPSETTVAARLDALIQGAFGA